MCSFPASRWTHACRVLLPFPRQTPRKWSFCRGKSGEEKSGSSEEAISVTNGLVGRSYNESVTQHLFFRVPILSYSRSSGYHPRELEVYRKDIQDLLPKYSRKPGCGVPWDQYINLRRPIQQLGRRYCFNNIVSFSCQKHRQTVLILSKPSTNSPFTQSF